MEQHSCDTGVSPECNQHPLVQGVEWSVVLGVIRYGPSRTAAAAEEYLLVEKLSSPTDT